MIMERKFDYKMDTLEGVMGARWCVFQSGGHLSAFLDLYRPWSFSFNLPHAISLFSFSILWFLFSRTYFSTYIPGVIFSVDPFVFSFFLLSGVPYVRESWYIVS